MSDFNAFDPPKSVTDPLGHGSNPQFPCALYKFGEQEGFPSLTIAWTRLHKPIVNALHRVTDDAGKAEALADGWSLAPVIVAPPEAAEDDGPKARGRSKAA